MTAEATFDKFWQVYPRKVGKRAAEIAYARAVTRADPQVILAAAVRLRDQPGREVRFTPHPTTWLREERWADEEGTPGPRRHPRPQGDQRPADGRAPFRARYLYVVTSADCAGWAAVPAEEVRLLLAESDEAALGHADFLAACHRDAGGSGNPAMVFAVTGMRQVGTAHADRHLRRQNGEPPPLFEVQP